MTNPATSSVQDALIDVSTLPEDYAQNCPVAEYVAKAKDLLKAAADNGGCLELWNIDGTSPIYPWERGGLERMYIGHPSHYLISGAVDLDTTTDCAVGRLELFAPPSVLAKIIRLVLAEAPCERPALKRANMTVEDLEVEAFVPKTKDPTEEDLEEMFQEEEEEINSLPREVRI